MKCTIYDRFMVSPPVSELRHRSRKHHRDSIRQLIVWAVRRDYLPRSHSLVGADEMRYLLHKAA